MTETETHKAECLEIHEAAKAIRRMDTASQKHAYETLARINWALRITGDLV